MGTNMNAHMHLVLVHTHTHTHTPTYILASVETAGETGWTGPSETARSDEDHDDEAYQ